MRQISQQTVRGFANTARFLLAAVTALATGACGPGRDASDKDTARTTVTVITFGGVRELGYEYDTPARHLLFLPLVKSDRDGEMRGRLARSWEHSEDGRSWTYHLRSDVR
jgi:ABC-type transport system substrate-binding protein